mmetsp:Transcript_47871/g.58854  ORF Transcript_47871/g.58854 Transcript_47871/m.58854 type:complete len:476 (+) Transcript_47871:29-1456(+)
MLFDFLQKGCIILLLHVKYVKTQESQWFGYPNLRNTYIAEFNAPNEGYVINKICMGNESIIDNIGDVSFTNEYNTYHDKHFYGSNTTIESCFESSSCINSVKITIGNYNSYDVITELTFKSDNNNEESFGGNNLYNPPRGSYYFHCQTGYCLSKITTKYNPYIHAIKFDCDVIRTLEPTKIPTKPPTTVTVLPTQTPTIIPSITGAVDVIYSTINSSNNEHSIPDSYTQSPSIQQLTTDVTVTIITSHKTISLYKLLLILIIGVPGWICCCVILSWILYKKHCKNKANKANKARKQSKSQSEAIKDNIESQIDSNASSSIVDVIPNDESEGSSSANALFRRDTNADEEGRSGSITIELPERPALILDNDTKFRFSEDDIKDKQIHNDLQISQLEAINEYDRVKHTLNNDDQIQSDSQIVKLEAINEYDKVKHTLNGNHNNNDMIINDKIIAGNLCMNIADMYILTKGGPLPPTIK